VVKVAGAIEVSVGVAITESCCGPINAGFQVQVELYEFPDPDVAREMQLAIRLPLILN
jgi:hypothetical protein